VPGARGRAGHASHAGDAQTCRGQGGRHRGGAEQGAAGEPQGSRQGASRVAARGHAGEAARGAARGAHGGGEAAKGARGDSRLANKEFGMLGHQIIFMLPGCFFLRVVTPSDFAHSDSFPPGDHVCSLKNLYWLLYVGQVFFDF
jgi:hypothetical protein